MIPTKTKTNNQEKKSSFRHRLGGGRNLKEYAACTMGFFRRCTPQNDPPSSAVADFGRGRQKLLTRRVPDINSGPSRSKTPDLEGQRTHQGSVLLYVLLTVALFMLMFSSLIYFLGRNTDYVATAMVQNKLYFDSTSTEEKILGMFQTNPSNTTVYDEVNKPTRDMKFDGYRNLVDSYVYSGKSDLIVVSPNDYNVDTGKQNLPQTLTITRQPGSFTDLFVLTRWMDPVSNFQQSSSGSILSSPTSGTGSMVIPLMEENGKNKLEKNKLEIIVSLRDNTVADAAKGALYTLTSDGTGLLNEHVHVELTVTSYEYAKTLGTGQTLTTALNADLKFPSYNRVSKADFQSSSTDQSLVSSLSNPGISTAYIDNFQLYSERDWTLLPTTETPASSFFSTSGLTLSNQTYTRQQSLKSDFDVRVIEKVPSSGQFQTGMLFVNHVALLNRSIYARVAIISPSSMTYYTDQDGKCTSTTLLASSTTDLRTFAFCNYYSGTGENPCETTKPIFRDHSQTCRDDSTAGAYPEFFPLHSNDSAYFTPDAINPDKVAIRLIREGSNITASYCRTGYDCEANAAWVDLGPQVSFPSGDVYPGLFDGIQDSVFSYFRATNLYKDPNNPVTFTSTIDYGKPTPVSTINLDGYKPDSANFGVQVSYPKTSTTNCTPLSSDPTQCDGGAYTSMVFTPLSSLDKSQIVTTTLKLKISFLTISGDLSAIPFIRSMEGYYDPGTGSCKPLTCDTITNPTSCTATSPCANTCGGSLVCSGETPPTCGAPNVMCNGQCVAIGTSCVISGGGTGTCNAEGQCATPVYTCMGDDPVNASLCTGDNIDLPADMPKTLVNSCSTPKCEFTCNVGFHYVAGAGGGGASCQADMCPVPTYTPSTWTNRDVNASVNYNGNSYTYTFTDNGAYNWSGTPCNANVDWIDKTPPTCGSWTPGPDAAHIPWTIGSQNFNNNATDPLSGIKANTNQCNVTVNGGTCNANVSDNAGNIVTCGPSPAAKIIDGTGLLFFADYTDNPNGLNSDIPSGTVIATNVNASWTPTTGMSVNPGAGNYVAYPASGILNASQGTIDIVVDGSQLKSAGYSYLFDMQKNNSVTYSDKLSLLKDVSYLKFQWWDTAGNWRKSYIPVSSLSTLQNGTNYTIRVTWTSDTANMTILNGATTVLTGIAQTSTPAPSNTPTFITGTSFFIGSQVGGAQWNIPNGTINGVTCSMVSPCIINSQYGVFTGPGVLTKNATFIKSVKIWNTVSPPGSPAG